MKKIGTVIFFIFLVQFAHAQFKFSVLAGLNESTLPIKPTAVKMPDNTRTGYHFGINTDFGSGLIAVQSGIIYSVKGGNTVYDYTRYTFESNIPNSNHSVISYTINYLQLPLNLLFHIHCGPGKLFVGGGVYAAYGLAGTVKTNYSNTSNYGTSNSGTTSNGLFGSGGYNRLDEGLNFSAGFAIKKFFISAGYAYGLTNLSKSTTNFYTTKNRCLSFSVGYYL